ncbi:TatD family hydrolase [Salipaludibacillus sp. LMS25]|jgi:TatD DNase family protein|uniref:Qat anti-phage system TatD family nuclease QatD n=1 Tax=Salipaludibacillus sp. LMS25 TaxID=2924031 RepID=UPI0020D01AC2|nr:Qat anti-phage system TatD family nuclease QatD [Salipaludibacillus sp. LMS25]UTR14912.1 TatD family hydrolase [Salipaludibacillus sp. LMS25]
MEILKYDTHAHIDLYKNMKDCINYIESSRSYTIVMTNVPDLYKKYIREHVEYKYVRFALGLHPELVHQYKSQISIFHEFVKTSRYIGEVGLDFTRGLDQEQVEVFKEIMRACEQYNGKIISVHSRRAADKVMDIIGESKGNRIILHWFSGTIKQLDKAINLGYYFSINTNMLNSKKGREIVKRIPTDQLLIESDAPFTNATKYSYDLDFIDTIFTKTADLLNRTEQEVREIYSENFIRLLKF